MLSNTALLKLAQELDATNPEFFIEGFRDFEKYSFDTSTPAAQPSKADQAGHTWYEKMLYDADAAPGESQPFLGRLVDKAEHGGNLIETGPDAGFLARTGAGIVNGTLGNVVLGGGKMGLGVQNGDIGEVGQGQARWGNGQVQTALMATGAPAAMGAGSLAKGVAMGQGMGATGAAVNNLEGVVRDPGHNFDAGSFIRDTQTGAALGGAVPALGQVARAAAPQLRRQTPTFSKMLPGAGKATEQQAESAATNVGSNAASSAVNATAENAAQNVATSTARSAAPQAIRPGALKLAKPPGVLGGAVPNAADDVVTQAGNMAQTRASTANVLRSANAPRAAASVAPKPTGGVLSRGVNNFINTGTDVQNQPKALMFRMGVTGGKDAWVGNSSNPVLANTMAAPRAVLNAAKGTYNVATSKPVMLGAGAYGVNLVKNYVEQAPQKAVDAVGKKLNTWANGFAGNANSFMNEKSHQAYGLYLNGKQNLQQAGTNFSNNYSKGYNSGARGGVLGSAGGGTGPLDFSSAGKNTTTAAPKSGGNSYTSHGKVPG